MTATAYGWLLLLVAAPVMGLIVYWPMLADGEGAADIHRIEIGLVDTAELREQCAEPCVARHCAEHSGVSGTVAQRRHSRAAEQRDAHRWNLPTEPWGVIVPREPIVAVPITPVPAQRPYGVRLTPTDLAAAYGDEPAPVSPAIVGVELLAIGGRR